MLRILRRVGGIKKLFFGLLGFLAVVYAAQTLVLNSSGGINSVGDVGKSQRFRTVNETNAERKRADLTEAVHLPAPVVDDKSDLCDVDEICPKNTLVFTVRSLSASENGDQKRPQFCVNGQIVSSAPSSAQSVSIVTVDETKLTYLEVLHFDVSTDDADLRKTLSELPNNRIIMVSSTGNIKKRLTEATISLLKTFGAPSFSANHYGLVLVGFKGALNSTIPRFKESSDTSDLEIKGCFQPPRASASTGETLKRKPPAVSFGQVARRETIEIGAQIPNCGVPTPCTGLDSLPISVYSGKNKDDEPKICIDGKLVISRSVNKGGRGLNAVILNATKKDILRVGNFDTYAEDSSSLEIFLEEMVDGEMIVAVTFDEASSHFSSLAKQLFYDLGSALIQNLKFRASWFIVGQKGISGFTPFEELNFATGNEWAKPIDKHICVPSTLDGLKVRPDPVVQPKNEAKRRFCTRYDGYEDFCDEDRMDEVLTPPQLVNRSLNGHPIFRIPILVASGLAHNSLRLCLETLIRQPGIDPKMVFVTYDENYKDFGELAELFHFRTKAIASNASYPAHLAKSMETLWEEYPKSDIAIILEEELMVTSDFLYFMAQMLPLLQKDETLAAVSAWNINGYTDSSSMPNLAYRVAEFPGLAFMVRKATYIKFMQGKMETCCYNRAWDGWSLDSLSDHPTGLYTIIPDVSRVVRRHVGDFGALDQTVEDLFHRERTYSKLPDTWITNVDSLKSENAYDDSIRKLIDSATPLDNHVGLQRCLRAKWHSMAGARPALDVTSQSASSAYVLYYAQGQQEPFGRNKLLRRLRRCFGLYYSSKSSANDDGDAAARPWTEAGFYKGVLRFSQAGHVVFLVSSKSPFYDGKHKILEERIKQQ